MALIGHMSMEMYKPKEIRAISGSEIAVPITLAPTAQALEKGVVLGIVTATGLFAPYKSGNTDGTEVARVILTEHAEASTTTQIASGYIKMIAKKDKLVGFDAQAMTDLAAREPVPGVIII